jgi:predicted TIM-barrel fold metal-dependent hydrolase
MAIEKTRRNESVAHNRIDVHQHLVPPFWSKDLESHGGDPSGWDSPLWSPEDAISYMDSLEIGTGMLSLTAPAIEGWAGKERADMARRVNDYGAGLVQGRPDRFGFFATLALRDVDAALTEIGRAFDELKVDGVVLMSNYEGVYLGHPSFEAVWKELDRRGAVVYIHPAKPQILLLPGIPGPVIDYPFDSTRTAVDLVAAGHMTRFRSVKVILSHAGGFLPYAAARFAELLHALNPKRTVEALTLDMQAFYFDTALSTPTGLPSLLAFAAPGHILFGSDYPYAPVAVATAFTHHLDTYQGFEAGQLAGINVAARALFPRLSKQEKTQREKASRTTTAMMVADKAPGEARQEVRIWAVMAILCLVILIAGCVLWAKISGS